MTYLVTQLVTYGGSVKRLQGVALLHKHLPVNSEFGAMRSSLSTSHFPFGCSDVVIDPWSRAALSDTAGLEWGVAVRGAATSNRCTSQPVLPPGSHPVPCCTWPSPQTEISQG